MRRFLIPTLLIAVGAALPAQAQSFRKTGEITAHFDGKDLTFHSLSQDSDGELSGTSAVYREINPDPKSTKNPPVPNRIAISGTIGEDGNGGMLTITLPYDTDPNVRPASPDAEPPQVIYFPDGSNPPYWNSEDGSGKGASVHFTRFEMDNRKGHAEGRFSARLCLSADFDDQPDTNTCKDISGTFNTELLAEN